MFCNKHFNGVPKKICNVFKVNYNNKQNYNENRNIQYFLILTQQKENTKKTKSNYEQKYKNSAQCATYNKQCIPPNKQ